MPTYIVQFWQNKEIVFPFYFPVPFIEISFNSFFNKLFDVKFVIQQFLLFGNYINNKQKLFF